MLSFSLVCRGLGMPISKEQGKFGDLKVKFDIAFPTQLSDEQKQKLRTIL
jgi:DnaJ homolog subfamily B member 4